MTLTDWHTLGAQIEQTTTLLQDLGAKPTTAVVDLGYRGVDREFAPAQLIHRGKSKSLTAAQRACCAVARPSSRPLGT